MIELLQTLLVVGGITFWLSRAERLVRDVIGAKRAEVEQARAEQAKAEQIPDDLLVQSQQFSHDWARSQYLDHMYELYGKLKDWSKVRGALAAENGTI